MVGIINFETFLITCVVLSLTPGNDTIFILSKSIAQGKKAGIISVLGIGTGSIIHTILAALGLSFIIAKSIVLFTLIKYIGAIYLIYIGFKMLFEKTLFRNEEGHVKTINYRKIYKDALITNVLNPKVALYFIALLPQFVRPNIGSTVLPFLILGATVVVLGTIWCFILAYFSSAIFSKLKNNSKASAYVNKICGCAIIALGVKVALFEKKQ